MNTHINRRRTALFILVMLTTMVLNVVPHPGKALAVSSASAGCPTIAEKYWDLGGSTGFLGVPIAKEKIAPDGVGHYQYFKNGSIYWSHGTCAHTVYGAILAKWAAMGWERSYLGYPVTDERDAPYGGRYNDFQGGSIYISPKTEAHALRGAIEDKWAEKRGPTGFLGYPVTDETVTPDGIGRFNYFEGGAIYWTQQTGAYEVHGAIEDKWASLGWEQPQGLGYPVTDETTAPDGGSYSIFQRGAIFWLSQPNVRSPITLYSTRDPLFQQGGSVSVDAGGCVQTGGLGRTWKRYVDPQGPNADHLYHGLIGIPGAPPRLVRIQDVIGQELPIHLDADIAGVNAFRLGYEDDDYDDNGYWGHDDGTGDQCKGVGPAWVRLTTKF